MAGAETLPNEVEVDNASTIEEVTPSEKPQGGVPIAVHAKLRGRAQDAEAKVEQLERDATALRQEKDLALMAIGSPQEEAVLLPPKEEDYYGDNDGWIAAHTQYNRQNTERLKAELQASTAEQIAQNNQLAVDQQAQDAQTLKRNTALNAHHERADTLNAPDYLDREQRVINNIGEELFSRMVENYPNSHELIFTLGEDSPEAVNQTTKLLQQFESDPWKGVTELDKYAASLKGKTTTSDHLPEPDTPLVGGSGGTVAQTKLDKMRADLLKGKCTMNDIVAFKRANNLK